MIIQNNGTPVESQPILNFTNATSVTADRDEARIDVVVPTEGGGGAPTNADYLVKTANAGLSAERVVTDTASITWDWATSGQAKANVANALTLNTIYPVGCLYLSVVSTSPATLFGMGTWVAFGAGKMFVGIDPEDTDFDTVEETGGAKTSTALLAHDHDVTDTGHNHTQDAHTHTQDAHTHTQNEHTHTQDSHTHTISMSASGTSNARAEQGTSTETGTQTSGGTTAVNQNDTAVNQNATATNQNATATNQSATTGLTVDSAGSGESFSLMNPYIVVFMWKRTA